MRVTGRSNEITVTSASCVRAGRVAPGRWLWPLRPSSRPSSEAIRPSAAGWCDYGERGQPASSNTCLLSQSPGRIHLSMEDPSLWTNCGSTGWSLTLVWAPLIFNQHFLLTFIFRKRFKALCLINRKCNDILQLWGPHRLPGEGQPASDQSRSASQTDS